MTHLRYGGRCDKHPLNINPCAQCMAEDIVSQNASRRFIGWVTPEQALGDPTARMGFKSLLVSDEWQPGRLAIYAEKKGPT